MRLGRKIRWLAIALAGLGVTCAALYVFVLPVIVRAKVHKALSEIERRGSTFTLRNPSLWGLNLTNVALGESAWLTADDVRIDYSPLRVVAGRVDAIDVSDATWQIALRDDGTIDLGPQFEARPETPPFTDLPFNQLAIANSRINVVYRDQEIVVNLNGWLKRLKPGRFEADFSLKFPPGDLSIPIAQGVANGVSSRLHLLITADPSAFAVRALEGTTLDIDALRLGGAEHEVAVQPLRVNVGDDQSRPALSVSRGSTPEFHVNAQASLAAPLEFATPTMRGSAPASSAAASLTFGSHMPLFGQATLTIANTDVTVPQSQLGLRGVNVSLPMRFREKSAAAAGQFSVDAIAWRDATLPQITGSISAADQRVTVDATWPLPSNATLNASAWLDFGDELRGQLTANIPPFELTDATLVKSLLPALRNVTIGGTYSVEALLDFTGESVQPLITVVARDGSLRTAQGAVAVDSADAAVTINSLAPLASLPDQRLHIKHATLGKLPVNDGEIVFTLERPDSVLVQSASWSMGAFGNYRAQPLRFDPRSPVLPLELQCDDVGLGAWLPMLSNNEMSGEGKLKGTMSITVRPASANVISIGSGQLSAEAAMGWIMAASPEVVGKYLQGAQFNSAGEARLGQAREQVLAALTNFRYSMLNVEFVPHGQATSCVVQTRGVGRTGAQPVEIGGISLNVENFDVLLRAILQLRSAVGSGE